MRIYTRMQCFTDRRAINSFSYFPRGCDIHVSSNSIQHSYTVYASRAAPEHRLRLSRLGPAIRLLRWPGFWRAVSRLPTRLEICLLPVCWYYSCVNHCQLFQVAKRPIACANNATENSTPSGLDRRVSFQCLSRYYILRFCVSTKHFNTD